MLYCYNPTLELLPLHPRYLNTAAMRGTGFSLTKIDLQLFYGTQDYRNSWMSYCASSIFYRKCIQPNNQPIKKYSSSTLKILTKPIITTTANAITITITAIVPSSVVSGTALVGCDLFAVPKNKLHQRKETKLERK